MRAWPNWPAAWLLVCSLCLQGCGNSAEPPEALGRKVAQAIAANDADALAGCMLSEPELDALLALEASLLTQADSGQGQPSYQPEQTQRRKQLQRESAHLKRRLALLHQQAARMQPPYPLAQAEFGFIWCDSLTATSANVLLGNVRLGLVAPPNDTLLVGLPRLFAPNGKGWRLTGAPGVLPQRLRNGRPLL